MPLCAGLRRPGAAALDLCYVAAGWYDAFFETGLSPWDVAAGSLIVTEAGGLVGNFTGEADFLYQREVLAGSPKVYAQLVPVLAPYTRVITEDDAAPAAPTPAAATPKTRTPKVRAKSTTPGTDTIAPTRSSSSTLTPLDVFIAETQPELVAELAAEEAAEQAAELAAEKPVYDIPLSPAAALAAAFEPMPDAEAAPAPVVTIRKPTRIKKEDMPPKEEPAPERKRGRRGDDAPF